MIMPETDIEKLKRLEKENQLLMEHNEVLSDGFIVLVSRSRAYKKALESINDRTGGILNRISGNALKLGQRLTTELENAE